MSHKNPDCLNFPACFFYLYTSIVLPVPHGLLEEGLVHPAEVGVDLVGNDCEVPDTLRPGGGGALVP